ncbi:MAG: hypothetical protein QXI58_00670 [Candidatus Micrarchaeia archaeon]
MVFERINLIINKSNLITLNDLKPTNKREFEKGKIKAKKEDNDVYNVDIGDPLIIQSAHSIFEFDPWIMCVYHNKDGSTKITFYDYNGRCLLNSKGPVYAVIEEQGKIIGFITN